MRLFELRRGGVPTAYVFLDPFARAEEKRGGAWMDEVCSRSRAFASAGSAVRLPVAHMVCNQSPPVTEADGSVTPSLMTFREVRLPEITRDYPRLPEPDDFPRGDALPRVRV